MQKLTTCADCGEQISCTARICPHCGRVTDPTMESNRKASYRSAGTLMEKVAVGVLLAGAIVGIWAAFQYKVISGEGYRLKESVNWLLAVALFVSSAFPAAVCYGIGKLIGAKADL